MKAQSKKMSISAFKDYKDFRIVSIDSIIDCCMSEPWINKEVQVSHQWGKPH